MPGPFFLQQVKRFVNHVAVAAQKGLGFGGKFQGSEIIGDAPLEVAAILLLASMAMWITGMILAIARGAGEVAPLMLVGAVDKADDLPLDGVPPYIHPQRSFMHLGYHIYDLGFMSQNSEAAKPMVYTTTVLLIGIVVVLNLLAIWVRGRLRRRFTSGA